MDWTIRNNRHVALIALIVAALPMLIYPNTFGVTFDMSWKWYVPLEGTYFFAVGLILYRRRSLGYTIVATLFAIVGRLVLSGIFMALLMALEQMPASDAFPTAFETFRPAVLLAGVTAPLLFSPVIKSILPSRIRRRHLQRHEAAPVIYTSTATPVNRPAAPAAAPTPTNERVTADFYDHSFNGAVQHIGSYSGVRCALLIDQEGLPIASWNRGEWDQEMWGALTKRIVDDLQDLNAKAGTLPLSTIEFKSGGHRFSLYRAADMWLLSVADADSDELEKIRLLQAAEMIERHCEEKYANVHSSEIGRKYAGSTV